jgi:tetratricopeptide (TPR) repeat protein
VLGPEHPDLDQSLNYLAELYGAQEQYVAAEHYYRRSLAIRERYLGPVHPAVARSLQSISRLYTLMGRLEDARKLADRAAKIRGRLR